MHRPTLRPLVLIAAAVLLSTFSAGAALAQAPWAQSHLPLYQRWSITVAHYDLPIREVDPHAADE
jgi:hypothetical protein